MSTSHLRLGWFYAAWAAMCALLVVAPFVPAVFVAPIVANAAISARLASFLSSRAGQSDHHYQAAARTVVCFALAFPLIASVGAFVASTSRGEPWPDVLHLTGGFLLMGGLAAMVAALLSLPVALGGTFLFIKLVDTWLAREYGGGGR